MQVETHHFAQTRLSEADIVDAEAARAVLNEGGHATVRLADLAREYCRRKPLAVRMRCDEAVCQYADELRARGDRKGYAENVSLILNKCFREAGREWLPEVLQTDLEDFVLDPAVSSSTQVTRRKWLHGFFVWAERKRFCKNIAAEVPVPRHRKALPAVFAVRECRTLLQAAAEEGDARMLPYLAVCLLSGVRPTEAKRMTDWAAFDFSARHIAVPEDVSKTRARFAPMHRNLRILLRVCKWRGLSPGYYDRGLFRRIRQRARLDFPWTGPHNDVLRHTYASHRYALEKDMAALSHAMGNSPAELKRSYLRPVTDSEARAFDGLMVRMWERS